MRRIIGLVLLATLFVACGSGGRVGGGGDVGIGNSRGELIVFNQSSSLIEHIKYCGRDFKYEGSSRYNKSDLPIGKSSRIQLDDVARGSVFFTVLDDKEKPIAEVRTEMEVVVQKGESYTFIITDSTLVIPTGSTNSIRLQELVSPLVLKVENRSSRNLSKVTYNERTFKNELGVGDDAIVKFYGVDSVSDYLNFWLCENNVKIEEKVEIQRGCTTTLTIDDDTIIIKNGKVKRVKVSELEEQGFEVVNNTSYDLYDVELLYKGGSFANDSKLYKDRLERDGALYAGFEAKLDSYGKLRYEDVYMYFKVRGTSGLEKKIRLDDSLTLSLNETKEVILLDDNEVRVEDAHGNWDNVGKLKDNVD